MSAPPPPYQNQPPQQPYGYPQQPQQPQPQYGQQPQQPYGQPQQPQYGQQPQSPQQPRGPRQPQRSPLRGLITAVIMLALFGGIGWYVWDYNTNPHGGKAKKEAAQKAEIKENDRKYNPKVGNCVKITGSDDDVAMEVVDCDSSAAGYKTGEVISGDERCGPQYTKSVHRQPRLGAGTTWCFTKV
ncbi:hypothetical protein [Streptomyces sp. NPDC048650]|uniref:LppU/SCO3897 family protein n=1 Tax=unclassified Streptomyces TaxID=2593676 RepID=UPI003710A3E1